jgi:hypothetical protein
MNIQKYGPSKPLKYLLSMSKNDMQFVDPDPNARVSTAFSIKINDSAAVKGRSDYSRAIKPFNSRFRFKMRKMVNHPANGESLWIIQLKNVKRDIFTTSKLTVTLVQPSKIRSVST